MNGAAPDAHRALLVDAFTEASLSGTSAALVPDADALAADQRRAIAREFGRRPTAFVSGTGGVGADSDADRAVQCRGGDGAVARSDLATVAAHAALHRTGEISAGAHMVATDDGPCGVEVTDDGRAWVAQPDATVRRVDVPNATVADALGVPDGALDALADDLPLAVAGTTIPCLVVPVTYLQHLGGASPDADALRSVCDRVDAEACYAFTFDTLEGHALHGRLFVPDGEWSAAEPVQTPGPGVEALPTGAGAGAVAAYLRAVGAFGSESAGAAEPAGGEGDSSADGSDSGDTGVDAVGDTGADVGHDEDDPADGDPVPDGGEQPDGGDGEGVADVENVEDIEGVADVDGLEAEVVDLDGEFGLAGDAVAVDGIDAPATDGLPDEFSVECGRFLERPALVHVRTRTGIQVGGRAAVALDASIAVPAAEDDDITVA